MKAVFKKLLASAGYAMERLPPGLPSGHFLSRDLALILGDRPGGICIDAGAHDGNFSELLLGCLPSPRIHAFEPAPEPFQRLRVRLASSPEVHLVPAGLSNRPGQLTFNIFENQALNSFLPLAPGAGDTFGASARVAQMQVPVLRLDDYAMEKGLDDIALLKIDTQGFELRVLLGAERLLAAGRVRAVLVELNFVPLYAGQVWAHELIAHLHERGLHLVDFYEKCRLNPFLGWCTALFARRDAGTVT
jgi:FkbM family methyltransferase